MKRDELGDLAAFLAVAEARNFTRAAAVLGTSQSALSHTIKRLAALSALREKPAGTIRINGKQMGVEHSTSP
jgi:hypothetical protein